MISSKCSAITQVTISYQHEIKRAQQITHLAAGTPNRKPLGLKSLHTHPCFCAARRRESQSTNPNTWSPRVRCFLWTRCCHPRPATLVGGPALTGCRARAKLVPRRLRMRHVPGPTTHAVAARRRPLFPRADVARVSCESAWRCIAALLSHR